jgi:hypothetical protein
MPIDFNIAAQSIFAGKNTPKYNRYDMKSDSIFKMEVLIRSAIQFVHRKPFHLFPVILQ